MPSFTPRVLIRTGLASVAIIGLLYLTSSSSTSSEPTQRSAARTKAGSGSSSGAEYDAEPVDDGWFGSSWSGGVKDWVQSSRWGGGDAVDLLDVENAGYGVDDWIDLGKNMPLTRYEGGIAGYQVFSNMYLHGSVLMSIRPSSPSSLPHSGQSSQEEEKEAEQHDISYQHRLHQTSASTTEEEKEWPDVKAVMSSAKRGTPAGEDRWNVVDETVGREELGGRAFKLGGVTYIFNDPPGPEGYLVYFRHFVLEAFLGATRVVASAFPSLSSSLVPKRVWFPRCGSELNWRDDRGENAWFLSHVLPSASVEDKHGWDDRNIAGLPIILEKVVIIDRWAAHAMGGEVGKWGKMNALVPTVHAPQSFWNHYRNNMIRSMGVDGSAFSDIGTMDLPVIVYVDRQKENPKMKAADHDALVEALKGLTDVAEVHVSRIGGMSKSRQIELMSKAEIIISLHGDDLFSSLWMPARELSTVIELFEVGGFARDYELLSTTLNHKYYAVQGDKVSSEDDWREKGASQGPERSTGEISINPETIINLVKERLSVHDISLGHGHQGGADGGVVGIAAEVGGAGSGAGEVVGRNDVEEEAEEGVCKLDSAVNC